MKSTHTRGEKEREFPYDCVSSYHRICIIEAQVDMLECGGLFDGCVYWRSVFGITMILVKLELRCVVLWHMVLVDCRHPSLVVRKIKAKSKHSTTMDYTHVRTNSIW